MTVNLTYIRPAGYVSSSWIVELMLATVMSHVVMPLHALTVKSVVSASSGLVAVAVVCSSSAVAVTAVGAVAVAVALAASTEAVAALKTP